MRLALCTLPILLLPLAGCATRVSHAERSEAQMRADVARCSDEANRRYWMDPVAALYNAYGCLEALGYQRDRTGLEAFVEDNFTARRRAAAQAPQPAYCQVPCRNGIPRQRR